MSKCIGGITHDVFGSVGALLSHSPDKSFGAYTRFGDSIVECDTLSFRLSLILKVRMNLFYSVGTVKW